MAEKVEGSREHTGKSIVRESLAVLGAAGRENGELSALEGVLLMKIYGNSQLRSMKM